MALKVIFENISGLAPVSDYRVRVFVNDRLLAGPMYVKGHKRVDGWKKLIEQFVREPDIKRKDQKCQE